MSFLSYNILTIFCVLNVLNNNEMGKFFLDLLEFSRHHFLGGWASLSLVWEIFFYDFIEDILCDFSIIFFYAYNLKFWSVCDVSKFYHVLITYDFSLTFTEGSHSSTLSSCCYSSLFLVWCSLLGRLFTEYFVCFFLFQRHFRLLFFSNSLIDFNFCIFDWLPYLT